MRVDHPLSRPLRSASEATGVSFDYLMRTAKRESNLDPKAEASGSSATGLFQFIEQTWLGLVKREGDQLGLKAQAEAIQQDKSGRFIVTEPEARRQILELRKDPELSARLAGVFTRENKGVLRESLGRDPSAGELYIAHFMGANGARDLIGQAAAQPEGIAAKSFPDAAAANRPIFYDVKGRARTNREVYAQLVAMHEGVGSVGPMTASAQVAPVTAAPQADARSPLAIAPAKNASSNKTMTLPRPGGQGENAFHGLFRSGGEGASASALRKTWAGFAESRLNKDAPSFFPREKPVVLAALSPEAVQGSVTDAAPSPLATMTAIDAPLPPVLPRERITAQKGANGKPLDLTAFLKAKR